MQNPWVKKKHGMCKKQQKGSMAEAECTKGIWGTGGDGDEEMAKRVGPAYLDPHRWYRKFCFDSQGSSNPLWCLL